MITNELRNLLAKATTHAQRFQDGEDHTVAAALLTKSGKHVLGLNAHHFLGGPCGEISALANHAASYPEDPIQAVVAVYGPTGQIIPPCGKCRQVLFDVDPSIRCIVRGSNGLEAPTVEELLRLPSFSGHPTCTDVVSVGEDVHCEPTTQEVHAGVPA